LNDQVLNLPYEIEGLKTDLHNLDLIRQGALSVKAFEFAGNRYKKSSSPLLIDQLKEELSKAENNLITSDREIVSLFFKAAGKHGQSERLRERYSLLFQATEAADEDLKKYSQMMQDISPIYYSDLPLADIQIIIAKIKNNEVAIKDRLTQIVSDSSYAAFLSEAEKQTVENYLSRTHEYFVEPNFNNEALALLGETMNVYQSVVSNRIFTLKKDLLEWQLSFIN
jgi:hypothetical protein